MHELEVERCIWKKKKQRDALEEERRGPRDYAEEEDASHLSKSFVDGCGRTPCTAQWQVFTLLSDHCNHRRDLKKMDLLHLTAYLPGVRTQSVLDPAKGQDNIM